MRGAVSGTGRAAVDVSVVDENHFRAGGLREGHWELVCTHPPYLLPHGSGPRTPRVRDP